MTPEVVSQQLEVIIRVTNNLIAARNEEQPELRSPLGATLVMAIHLPQLVQTAKGTANAPELYIARLGDSYAYWIDARQILPLTASSEAIDPAQVESTATTIPQALGISDPELVRPQIQRLIIEEDGLLLLCSESISNNCLEKFGVDCVPVILAGKMTAEEAVQSLIELSDRHNLSVVLTHYRVSFP
jgi:protein phosphatase